MASNDELLFLDSARRQHGARQQPPCRETITMTQNNDLLFADSALLQQAERLCKQRLRNDPENQPVIRSLAEVHRRMGNLVDAAAAYGRLCSLDPLDHEAAYLQAVLGGKECLEAPGGIRAAPFVLLKEFLQREFHDVLLRLVMSVQDQFVPVLGGDGAYKSRFPPGARISRRMAETAISGIAAGGSPSCDFGSPSPRFQQWSN